MQAYCLITDGTDCLIPKKAIENDLWGGERSSFGPVLVNQPGQYALFGGKVEAGEHAKESAQREVLEESGVDISSMSPVVTEIAAMPGMYKCYAVVVSPEQLVELRQQMSRNIAEKKVKDGEMSSVDAVPLERVIDYLGVDQKPSLTPKQQQQYTKGEAKKPGRHSIVWYGEIASATREKLDEIRMTAAVHRNSIERERVGSPETAVSDDVSVGYPSDNESVRSEVVVPQKRKAIHTTTRSADSMVERLVSDPGVASKVEVKAVSARKYVAKGAAASRFGR